jgi:acetoin:2,6-dichlorophenolindophenol oxidoreductase subunit beta
VIYARELNDGLRRLLDSDERIIVMGEDIADPYGGAFKVTRGLTTAFPDRVLTTPVSEGAIVGMAAGLALSGHRPIVEIMFGDFISLTFDQVVNHIAKYEAMYDGKVTCPVIIRTPSGGHRGYGPTHSQSLEKHFMGVPHLTVAAASPFHDPWRVLSHLVEREAPALFIEHKLLYPEHLSTPADGHVGSALAREEASNGGMPAVVLSQVPAVDCTVTVLAYGYSALHAAKVLEQLAIEEEIFGELIVPAQIAPMDWGPVEKSVARTGSLVTVEEGMAGWSWGTEAAAEIGRRCFSDMRRPVEVVASRPTVIPSSREQEQEVLVGAAEIARAVREAAG